MAPHSFNSRNLIFNTLVASASAWGFVAAQEVQSGTNNCTTTSSQDSKCQNIYVNGLDDFCIFGPPGTGETVGQFERRSVAWCTQDGHGTRLIPQGTFTGVHYVETDAYIQVTGVGDLTSIGMVHGDYGGELDFSGADGLGNPISGKAFTTSLDAGNHSTEVKHWISFISDKQFCLRVCKPAAPGAKFGPERYCEHIYDTLGCAFNVPGDYTDGFDSCESDAGTPQGIYINGKKTSTYQREASPTPKPHPQPSLTNCHTTAELAYATAAPVASGHHNTTHTPGSSDNSTDTDGVVSNSGSGNSTTTTTGQATTLGAGMVVISLATVLSAAAMLVM